ncbi:amidase [Metabacillus litoralis]|uniref:amidase n=1 Tax=Metabacillus litoralis TaxID=152268 RepID=UPI001CFE481E|nr:amidase [Metabacillus litoralis]
MKMLKGIICVLTALFVLGSQLGVIGMNNKATAMENPISPEYSTWLWDTNKIVNDRVATLQFLEEKQVKHVYLQINRNVNTTYYKKFISEASIKNIKVYALDGDPNWGPTSKGFTNFLSWVTTYQQSSQATEKFSGIHLDIEPYLTPLWTSNYKAAVNKYQNALIVASNKATSLGISFAVDIPFWFDEMTYKNKHGKGNLAKWAINLTDEVTIMAYRDKAVGPNGIIELVKYEMNTANTLNKKVNIAVETMNLGNDGFLTFYEEGQAAMNTQLELVQNSYGSYSNFNGFAVHHVGSWMELK